MDDLKKETPKKVVRSDKATRIALFTPCKSKEDLHRWIKVFCDIDLPDCKVCEESTSTPMDLLWDLYSKALEGTDPKFTQVLGYSTRGGGKTLIASMMELLCLFHLHRDCIHFASLEAQAKVCTDYIEKYLKKSIFRGFVVSKNKRTIEICWYQNKDKTEFYSVNESKKLQDISELEEKRFSVKIVVATLSSVNGVHGSMVINDECDLTSKRVLDESKGIPVPGKERGELPITFYTSTRKFSFGNVQDIINTASETGVIVKHWNILDVTKACPPERHLPSEPKIPIYYSDRTLESISEEQYLELPFDKKPDFVRGEGYTGCLRNCRLFASCKTRLVTNQKSTSPILKPIDYVQNIFKTTPLDIVKAQFLCLRPSMEGMIYPRIDRDLHCLSAAQIANKLTGEKYPDGLSKKELLGVMNASNGFFSAGIDWGFTHCFAGCVGFVDGDRMFIVESWEVPELELPQKLELAEKVLRPYSASAVWADPAYPSDVKTFKRAGYRMKDWNKGAGSVIAGIEIVRMKLMPTFGAEPQLYFLRDDPGCELLVKRMAVYHWKVDSNERPTSVPEDKENDSADSLRYLVMNTFTPRGKISIGFDRIKSKFFSAETPQYTSDNWMSKVIQEQTGGEPPEELPVENDQDSRLGKKRGILFKF